MMNQTKDTVGREIEFSSELENISLVEQMIDGICDEYQVSEDYYGNILIALTEAVNNAINHGNEADPSKKIKVSFESADGVITFFVEDEGNGFDYENLPDPTDPENIDKPNGRGVFLMQNLADEVTFHDDGKKVEMNFNAFAN